MKKILFLKKNPIIFLFFMILFMMPDKSDAQSWCLAPSTSSYTQFDPIIRSRNETGPFYLRIYVHVIRRSDGTGGQTVEDVYEALSYLDEAFNPHNIYFIWNGEIDDIKSDYYYEFTETNPPNSIFHQNPHNDGIDIYLFRDDLQKGWGMANGIGSTAFYVIGNTPYPPHVSHIKSHIISHEMGHCLNLYHPFQGPNGCLELVNGSNCEECGDLVCDTPADFFGNITPYNVNPNSCIWLGCQGINCYDSLGDPYNPNPKLIMGYTHVNCSEIITPGQGQRMRNSIDTIPILQACIIPLADSIISDVTQWGSPVYISGNVIVKNGGELKITDTVYFVLPGKIVVEQGGKLIVDNGIITTKNYNPWLGIEVLGDPELNQSPTSNQGWVQVINGGTIANAETAIRAGIKTFSEERFNYTQTGGIVQVENAIFSNNQTAIEMLPYNNINISYIRHSTFETKATVLNTVVPDYFIKLIANNIQDISGCTFKNYRNVLEPNSLARGNGIYVFNSNLKNKCSSLITPCPPTEYYPNKFTNLYYGIYVLSAGHNSYISVIKNEFENNYRSLYLSGVTNARVTSNDFIINTPFEENGGYGMYLDGCTGYWVEDNEFRHNGTSATGIGLIVNNSGTNPNEVYRNRFIRLEQGISAQGTNKDYNTNIGLQLLCNDFVDTWADILIPKSESDRRFGIAAWQGDSTFVAGNLFHHHTGVPYNDINNEGEHITYFVPYNYDQVFQRVIPQSFTANTVTITSVLLNFPWSFSDGCPCKLSIGGGGNEEELMQQMAESSQQEEEIRGMLALMVDGGNTNELSWDVYMSTSPEAMELYDELMAISPWLSDTVVSNAIYKEDVLINAMIRDIMVANPQTAKSAKLMDELNQRWTPLPDYMKAQILQGKNFISLREKIESKLARHLLDKAIAVSSLARIFQNDNDSLIWLWENDNSLASKYNLAFMYLEMGQSVQGTAVLNNIPSQINLSNLQQSEYQQIQILYDILASLAQEGKGIQNAESQHISMLLDIESESTGPAAVYARNALLALQALTYNEPILLPDLLKSRAMETTYQTMLENLPTKSLNVYPLPARDFLIVEYVMDAEAKGRLEFTDDTGRLVHTMEVSGPVNQQIINTRDWKSGWYVASLKIQTKTMESVKFIITD